MNGSVAVKQDGSRSAKVKNAVHRYEHLSKQGLLERAFTFAFRGLVYAQIWEDPVIDLEAMALNSDCHIVTIASGGCNVFSYLTADPAKVTAVDLNTAHIALGKLKLAAAAHLPDHAGFHRFFAQAEQKGNVAAYKLHVRPHLDETTRRYWEGRDISLRRRIGGFNRNIYKRGLLGNFIGVAHLLTKLYKVDLREMLAAKSVADQRAFFDSKIAPIFDKKFVRWLTSNPASLFGLGIPPAQYLALAGDDPQGIIKVLHDRTEKLACDFEIGSNYFAHQAFGRGYGKAEGASLPPYLEAAHYEAVVSRLNRVEIRHANFVEFLGENGAASLDRYVLLDAQDWMTDDQLNQLWREITRTAKPGARVIFRTAAAPSLLPGRVMPDILGQWHYRAEESLDYTRRDRSSIYGGFHLYILKA
jgi:S-adenosylmethionine-diacylglycerol 3-amino-3-carboxypropyl transferase